MSDSSSSSGQTGGEEEKSGKRIPSDGDCEHLGKKEDNGETWKRKG